MKKYLFILFILTTTSAIAQDIKFKYLALNVPDKMEAAQWWHNTLNFNIIKEANEVYVSDAGNNFRIKFFSDPLQKNNYSDVSFDACHIALESDNLSYWEQKILKAGGKYNTPPRHNLIGDAVVDMRDPHGIMIQLIYRVHPYYTHKSGTLRFEHLALNMTQQKDAALWYVEFMGLTIPWSKDPADSTRAVSTYRIPYVGDPGRNMAMEFLSTGPERDYTKLGFGVSYIAFEVKDATTLAKKMISGGAKQISNTEKDANKTLVIKIRCPWGNMLELIEVKKQ
ncbi:VOC family protein [Mucilaginibacter sp.]|uniref:VOC family protein n=1 Tax=Mucilaginibacter sp. TaxID=1882438 RepID=UPI002625DF74|nr:VOC family protein [Mucilaginibacter sp.]MDB4926001.1 ribosomal protein [Mucilaginibacter sp.]